jgi:hypothetical protein
VSLVLPLYRLDGPADNMRGHPVRLARALIRDSTAVRKSITEKIVSGGFIMSSCTNCRLAGRASCRVSSSPKLSKCASCTSAGVPCDVKEFDPSACMLPYSSTPLCVLSHNFHSVEDHQGT